MKNSIIPGILMILLGCAFVMTASAGTVSGDIESAFRSGNPNALSGRLPDSGKVFLSIPAAGVSAGSYSRQQILTTLRQMFRRNKTKSVSASGGTGNAIRVVWTFKGKGKSRTITIYIAVSNGKISSIRGEK